MRLLGSAFVLLQAISLVSPLPPQELQQKCREATRPHTTRCDQYFRCALLPSKTTVWITTQCQKGLVYQHSMGLCVVPDINWECDPSAETERIQSEENVYGIDNLLQFSSNQAATYGASTTTTAGSKRGQYKLPSVLGDNMLGIYIVMDSELSNRTRIRSSPSSTDEIESSGDGNSERPFDETNIGLLTDNFFSFVLQAPQAGTKTSGKTESSWTETFDRLTPAYRNQLVHASDTSHSEQGFKGRLPLPPDGKIHPEHLTQIINQQKHLNRIATEMKQHSDPTGGADGQSPFTKHAVFLKKPTILHGSNANNAPDDVQQQSADAFSAKGPYVSEDIIRSILQISQQMIVNQKPSTIEVVKDVEPASSSTFIPISLSAIPKDEIHKKSSSTFSAKPIGISFTGPYKLDYSKVYDNLGTQPANQSGLHYGLHPTSFDSYANRFTPKEPSQSMTPNFPSPAVPPLTSESLTNVLPTPIYPSFVSPYVSSPQGSMSMMYIHPKDPHFPQRPNSAMDHYGAPDRTDLLDSIEFNESGVSDSSDSDYRASLSHETDSDESAQNDAEGVTGTQFKRKLYTLGAATLKNNRYKDSILPLLDASPDDVRISVVTCTLLGSRQPNKTDCFKYYVCNPHTGVFQSFTCPSFTAFNRDSRLCDTLSYKSCKIQQTALNSASGPLIHIKSSPTKHNSNHLRNDLLTAQTYVELMRHEADKLLTRHSIRPQDDNLVLLSTMEPASSSVLDSNNPPVKIRRKHFTGTNKNVTTTTGTSTTAPSPAIKRRKAPIKRPRCRSEGRMPDPAFRNKYYVCHRKSSKKFVKMKLTCPPGLMYCIASQYCMTTANC